MNRIVPLLGFLALTVALAAADQPEVGRYWGEKNTNDFIELKADGSFVVAEGSEKIEGRYSLTGTDLSLTAGQHGTMALRYEPGVIVTRSGEHWAKAPSPRSREVAEAADVVRVLFIGNSQTWFVSPGSTNALPVLLEQMAAARGRGLKCDVGQCRGGFSLQKHWELGKAQEVIRGGKWDFVVLQELVTLPVQNREAFVQYVRLFHEVVKGTSAKTALYLTAATASPDGHPDPRIQETLNAAYQELAKELGVTCAPVGPAWQEAVRALPELRLFADGDFVHPSPIGSYLNACVFFATLLGESPAGLPAKMQVRGSTWDFAAALGVERLSQLQRIAWDCSRPPRRE